MIMPNGSLRRALTVIAGISALFLAGCAAPNKWTPGEAIPPGQSIVISRSTLISQDRDPSNSSGNPIYLTLQNERGEAFKTNKESFDQYAVKVVPSGVYGVAAMYERGGLSLQLKNGGRDEDGRYTLGFAYIPPNSVVYLGDVDVIYTKVRSGSSFLTRTTTYPFKTRINDNTASASSFLRTKDSRAAARMEFIPITFAPHLAAETP
ncbi:MAG: hypothetical protein H7Y60_14515 [Rhodospirillaceae bacterium]|nr:hypothetical protein [Rhodospirillales bacterium]